MAKFGEKKLSEEERRERERKQKEEQEQRKKIIEEQRFNRRVNFLVMRYMWQVIRGRSAEDKIYNNFNISRERYTRVIDTGIVRFSKEELEFLEKKSGVSKGIFTGEERFTCYGKRDRSKEEIVTEEWKKLFELRDTRIKKKDDKEETEYKESCLKYAEYEKDIFQRLKGAGRTGDTEFSKFCAFLKSGHASREIRLNELHSALKLMSFSVMDECDVSELQRLYEGLKEKSDLAYIVLHYKRAQRKK